MDGVAAETGSVARALGQAAERVTSASALRFFWTWTAVFWGGVGIAAGAFFLGYLDFATSTKIGLYAISIWLNAWVVVWFLPRPRESSPLGRYHDCLVVWMLSYALTNVLWEIPWVICSPFVFESLQTLDDVVARTDTMRESILQMYFWVLASFGSVDLRTVNHDSTFFTLEMYAFVNVAATAWFFRLNAKRSPYRYLVPVLGCGEPVASTFIFSFSEVFGGFPNMTGGVADTLLALLWTQYQYFVFPLIFGLLGYRLLVEDLRQTVLSDA